MEKNTRFLQLPETEESIKRGRTEDWLDINSIESFQGFKDGTITVTTKSGRSIKYGPFSDDDYNDILDVILEH